jgi:hypothetical protein
MRSFNEIGGTSSLGESTISRPATAHWRLEIPAKAMHANVRFGSKADISECPRNVRFTPNSGHSSPQL